MIVYHAHIENGAVVLDEPATLPEGARVEIALVVTERPMPFGGSDEATPSNGFLKFAGKATGLPADASRNMDHYLYGYPRQ